MLFNSLGFALFLPIVFFLYWFATKRKLKYQNILLLIASYFFYASWDYRFLFLLIFSTFLDYSTGIKMDEAKNQKMKRFWFWLSICVNLGFLGVFKYYNFFATSFADALSLFGLKTNPWILQVILPVGISFYTFHGLSYVIDIYNGKIKPEKNFIDYSLFVGFFPLLVAGPIERATHLLPQIKKERHFDAAKAVDGLRQILWGFFKKIVIADNCADYVNTIFNNAADHSGSTLVLGAVFFAIQVYADFSGYSDIALGVARLFGIELLRNFAFPYFSRDIAEFWKRWHISLSSWLRDYVFDPISIEKRDWGKYALIYATFITFFISGLWHGANWTFIVWGLLHATYYIPLLLAKKRRKMTSIVAQGKFFPSFREVYDMTATFSLVVFALIFFRARDLNHAFSYIKGIFSRSLFKSPDIKALVGSQNHPYILFVFIFLFMLMEWMGREHQYALAAFGLKWPKAARWAFYYCIALFIFLFAGKEQQFIYFQF